MRVIQDDEPVRVMALHSLTYCERLFYFEEVEGVLIADDLVYSGRALHEGLCSDDLDGKWFNRELSSENLRLTGKTDFFRYRDGKLVPYEHKRGKAKRNGKESSAWLSDAIQVSAYGMLLEEEFGCSVSEGRIRYHADNTTVRVALDDSMRKAVIDTVNRVFELRANLERPGIAENDRLCIYCSLAPVCLPEEERLLDKDEWEPIRLFPADRELKTLHIVEHGCRITRKGNMLVTETKTGNVQQYPIREVEAIVLHGYPQITTQALYLCVQNDIAIHWISAGQKYVSGIVPGKISVQRRIRQYQALVEPAFTVKLSRKLVKAKVETALRYALRATRGLDRKKNNISSSIKVVRSCLKAIESAGNLDEIRGYEGLAGKEYFKIYSSLIGKGIPSELCYEKRSRRPPKDRINAILSFGYSLLYQSVLQAVLIVGLEPSFGFYHTPRSSAYPLVLDLMELFRLQTWDIVVLGSINRNQWDIIADFNIAPGHVWLSNAGRKKAINLFENRMNQTWKHPVIGYSLTYSRLIELEVRLLEKEWSGSPGLFARMRIR